MLGNPVVAPTLDQLEQQNVPIPRTQLGQLLSHEFARFLVQHPLQCRRFMSLTTLGGPLIVPATSAPLLPPQHQYLPESDSVEPRLDPLDRAR